MLSKKAAEVRTIVVDFREKLLADELLSGTPTVAEVTTSDLTISEESLTVTPMAAFGYPFAIGPYVPTDHGVQFLVAGGTAGTEYTIRITATTDDGQTLIQEIVLRVN